MSENALDTYMFLGLPLAGKTTYFCTMADNLQDVANNSGGKMNLRVMSNIAQKYIEDAMVELRKQEWPGKTHDKLKEDLELKLEYYGTVSNYICNFVFHDYPGEAVLEAFGGKSEELCSDAKDLKNRLVSANGVFLLLSAEDIFNDEDDKNERTTVISEILRYIFDYNKKAKIAILFNKIELFPEYNHDEMVKLFRELYKFAIGFIEHPNSKDRCSFFSVYTLGGNCEINEEGEYIPPRDLTPKDLLKPISWMTDLDLDNHKKSASQSLISGWASRFK